MGLLPVMLMYAYDALQRLFVDIQEYAPAQNFVVFNHLEVQSSLIIYINHLLIPRYNVTDSECTKVIFHFELPLKIAYGLGSSSCLVLGFCR